jgi:hypothetical protein
VSDKFLNNKFKNQMADEKAEVTTTSKRERKPTTVFNFKAEEPKKIAVQEGKGVKLGEYSYFTAAIDKLKGDDDLLKALHSLLFNSPGKKVSLKKNLKTFSGFSEDVSKEDKIAKVTEKKKTWTVALLKSALDLFGLEKSGDREAIIDRLVTYLFEPSILKEGEKKKKGAAKTPKKRKQDKENGEPAKRKKTASAYNLFVKAIRVDVKNENPEATFGEISRLVAQKWTDLGDDEKEVLFISILMYT